MSKKKTKEQEAVYLDSVSIGRQLRLREKEVDVLKAENISMRSRLKYLESYALKELAKEWANAEHPQPDQQIMRHLADLNSREIDASKTITRKSKV